MNTPLKADAVPKWYQEPIVWLIWGLLITVVVACFITVVLAVKSDDGMVTQEYYKDGLAINTVLNANAAAESLGINASIDAQAELISIRLDARQLLAGDTVLELQWAHPINHRLDAVLPLAVRTASGSDGVYHWQLSPSQLGLHDQWQTHRWYTRLSLKPSAEQDGPTWRIQGVVPVCCNKTAQLQAQ